MKTSTLIILGIAAVLLLSGSGSANPLTNLLKMPTTSTGSTAGA